MFRAACHLMLLATVLALVCGCSYSAPAAAPAPQPSVPSLAPRPPMGWNSWVSYGGRINEEATLANARAMAEKLKPFGYDTIVVDGGWLARPDEFGRLQVSARRFPRGMKAVAAEVHALGLKLGVHIMRGIPRAAVDRNLPIHGTNVHAQDIADTTSICPWSDSHYGVDMDKPGAQAYYDDWIALIASYDVDFIKADDLTPWPREIEAIADAIAKTGRPIVYSLSPGDVWNPDHLPTYRRAAMVRLTRDIWDKREDLDTGFDYWLTFSQAIDDPANPGVWPDLDMIPFGHLRVGGRGSGRWCRFTPEQKRTFITQRAMAASPLFIGGSLLDMDEDSMSLLTNRHMIKCNQNGVVGRRVFASDNVEVWRTPLRGRQDQGWIGIFNRNTVPKRVTLTRQQLGLDGSSQYSLRDVWQAKAVSLSDNGLELELAADDVCFVKYQAAKP